jgi:hypothetical protein
MFNNDNKDWERFKNFSLFNMWATDKEVEDAAPAMGCAIVIILIIVLVAYFFF